MVFSQILDRYGQPAEIVRPDGTGQTVMAFVQPVMEKNSPKSITLLGERDLAKYYYFGPPDAELGSDDGTYIVFGAEKFDVLRCELYTVNGIPSHREGVLQKREAE